MNLTYIQQIELHKLPISLAYNAIDDEFVHYAKPAGCADKSNLSWENRVENVHKLKCTHTVTHTPRHTQTHTHHQAISIIAPWRGCLGSWESIQQFNQADDLWLTPPLHFPYLLSHTHAAHLHQAILFPSILSTTTTTKHWLTLGECLKQEAERKCTSCRQTERSKCQHDV